jgi:hypothetical protein
MMQRRVRNGARVGVRQRARNGARVEVRTAESGTCPQAACGLASRRPGFADFYSPVGSR